ncbi:hypothetical protein GCM10010276_87050 [Streptomyces longisporus]|uniref:Transposase n=1 Tax=Streptomyces longisporus TaxID=1948 RepID=A0ABP6AT20_STRLO
MARDPGAEGPTGRTPTPGSQGGRPPGFDPTRYKKRNTVERAINKLKQFPAVATRYDKRGHICLGTVTTASVMIWLRS